MTFVSSPPIQLTNEFSVTRRLVKLREGEDPEDYGLRRAKILEDGVEVEVNTNMLGVAIPSDMRWETDEEFRNRIKAMLG